MKNKLYIWINDRSSSDIVDANIDIGNHSAAVVVVAQNEQEAKQIALANTSLHEVDLTNSPKELDLEEMVPALILFADGEC